MSLTTVGGTLSVATGSLAGLAVAATSGFVNVAFAAGFVTTSSVAALTGVQSTDVLVAFASSGNGTRYVTQPSGWTQIATSSTTQAGVQVFTAPGSANAATSWTWPTQQNSRVVIAAYRGVSAPSTASVVSSNTTSVATISVPAQTTTKANAFFVCYGGASAGTAPSFTPTLTSRASSTGATGFLLGDTVVASVGTTSAETFGTGSSAILTGASLHLELL